MPEPYNLTGLNEIPRNELENMASKPLDELDLAIKPNTLKTNKKYIVAFRATRPSGVYGELRYTMLINSPPVEGSYLSLRAVAQPGFVGGAQHYNLDVKSREGLGHVPSYQK